MKDPKSPYDPQPARDDAFAEAAREGVSGVPGDHAERLASMRSKLNLPPPQVAIIRQLSPKPYKRVWLAPAAAAAILILLIVAYTQFTSSSPTDKFASNQTDQAVSAEPVTELDDNTKEISLEETDLEAPSDVLAKAEKIETSPVSRNARAIDRNDATTQLPPIAKSQAPRQESSAYENGTADQSQFNSQPNAVVVQDVNDDKAASPKQKTAPVPAPASPVAADKQREYELERGAIANLTTIKGRVLDQSGDPMIGVKVGDENTKLYALTDAYGDFTLEVLPTAEVIQVIRDKADTVRFDARVSENYEIRMPLHGAAARVLDRDRNRVIQLIYPLATSFPEMNRYLASEGISGTQSVVVQFEVNRKGRPKNIVAGPGEQDRQLVRRARELLRNAPDWPTSYRRGGWRYEFML